MSTVHKEPAHELIFAPFVVVQAIIHNQESAWVKGSSAIVFNFLFVLFDDLGLAFDNGFNDKGIVFFVNETFRNHGAIETIGAFGTTDDGADAQILVII